MRKKSVEYNRENLKARLGDLGNSLHLGILSPDLDPSDFHLFLKLKELLGGKRFGSDEELENAVTTWFSELETEEYNLEIVNLVERYDRCLNVGGDYVQK
ncbi:hypothetical protein AVEN_71302-1 [Araneus ventricosus]|uniref:Uncharacterized protein n=1 Tax=Araneus ventricosus TaxID=182803 RepID=A0A4Y2B6X0_ARAVE|nr:hypothetical protein AVEN_71302-1 [Araneus ventricosus]